METTPGLVVWKPQSQNQEESPRAGGQEREVGKGGQRRHVGEGQQSRRGTVEASGGLLAALQMQSWLFGHATIFF